MSLKPIDLTGGKSVYCFNEQQIRSAHEMVFENDDTREKLEAELKELESKYSRNERAALSFVLIDRLLKTSEE